MPKPKIIVILGPTASGKSDVAVKIARKFGGEIISADSRQVYKGLNIGTGKITKKEMSGIPHYLLDVANPKRRFTVSDYKKLGEKAIAKILNNKNIPIIVGGTGLYISALLGEMDFPEVPPNTRLRRQLEKKPVQELFMLLKNLDTVRSTTIDKNNPRRLVRAIEIAVALGKNPKLKDLKKENKYDVLKVGIKVSQEELKQRINKRLKDRLKKGMIKEAHILHRKGLSYKRMRELGLEYRRLADYLENKIDKETLEKILQTEIYQYAKRQMTWFKRDKDILWLKPNFTLSTLKGLIIS